MGAYMSGLFITMEGLDGSGKTTQLEILKQNLEAKGFNVLLVREPGGSKISEKIRNIILDIENKEMHYMTEALLYSASRAQLVHEVIMPSLKQGKIVLCDRFVDSSLVYQGVARGLGIDIIKKINNIATEGLTPDITFFLDIEPKFALERKKQQKKLDRIESEKLDFYNMVYKGYKTILKSDGGRIIRIDANKDLEDIQNEILTNIENLFC